MAKTALKWALPPGSRQTHAGEFRDADTWTRQKSSHWQRGPKSPQISKVLALHRCGTDRAPLRYQVHQCRRGTNPGRAWRTMASVKSSGCCWRTRCEMGITTYQGPAA